LNQVPKVEPTPFKPLQTNRKAVNIVAMGSSRSDFTSLQMTENRPEILVGAELWVINYLGGPWRCDRIIHVDPVHPYLGNPPVADMCNNSLKDGTPVYTSWPHPLYPNHVLYPFDKVVETLGAAYINTSVSAAIALALYEGFNEINLFGCDFSYPNAHISESGRACCEFWLGVASQRGVRIGMASSTTLLDTHCGQHPYGWFANPMQPPVNGGALMNTDQVREHCRKWREPKLPRADFYSFDMARPATIHPLVENGEPHPDLLQDDPSKFVISQPQAGLHSGVFGELTRAANLSLVALHNAQAAQQMGVTVKTETEVPTKKATAAKRKTMNGKAPPPSEGVSRDPRTHKLPRAAQ
jgi:hypothetical protein